MSAAIPIRTCASSCAATGPTTKGRSPRNKAPASHRGFLRLPPTLQEWELPVLWVRLRLAKAP